MQFLKWPHEAASKSMSIHIEPHIKVPNHTASIIYLQLCAKKKKKKPTINNLGVYNNCARSEFLSNLGYFIILRLKIMLWSGHDAY